MNLLSGRITGFLVWCFLALVACFAVPRSAFAQTPSWSAVSNMAWARNKPSAVASGGLLYAVSDTSSGGNVEAYNPSTGIWSSKAAAGPLAADVNGTLYAAWIPPGGNTATLSKYNAAANSWTAVSTSPSGLADPQMVAVGTEIFFVTRFGRPATSSPFTIGLHVYDTITGTWTLEVGQFQGAEEYQGTTAVALDGKIYFIGGKPYVTGFSSSRVVVYELATGLWTVRRSLPVAIAYAGATAVNGKIYVVGGQTGLGVVENATQVYDPATDSWSLLAALPTARFNLGVVSLGGSIYALGGNDGNVVRNTVEKLTLSTAAVYYRIKNRWQGTYIHTENLTGQIQIGSVDPAWWSAQWSLEDSGQGSYRIKNRWTGKYIHIESQTGRLQYGDIYSSWDSAKWFFDTFNGYKRIRSLWTNQFAHIESQNGFVQYGSVYDSWESAQWTLEPVQ